LCSITDDRPSMAFAMNLCWERVGCDKESLAPNNDNAPGDSGMDTDFCRAVAADLNDTKTKAQSHKLAYRLLLRTLMIEFGFNPYAQEWWPFTLADEPYPDTYYDFLKRGGSCQPEQNWHGRNTRCSLP
jgi:hypothetical protein